jgi:tetratricopeptide (TPR) repeat protein
VGSYLDQAVAEAEAALKIKPDALDAQSLLAWLLYINGQKERALLIYGELRERYPEQAGVFLGRNPEILAELTGAVAQAGREARK